MSKFKVGDNVRRIAESDLLKKGKIYQVTGTTFGGLGIYVSGTIVPFKSDNFELVNPTLDEQLEEAVSELEECQEAMDTLEERVEALRKAIKERDKPRGRVGIKDSLQGIEWLFQAHCNGQVCQWNVGRGNQAAYIAMGNLYYDEESAKLAQHQRKQQILLEEGEK